ncbi:GNAT family N-acetyltransferase [Chryseobacterium sp.]|uniref:GNAT family N-acetyltransferase n=1 Tax=Chryseobacterium sp. TaxID=1871047 RepID=UPI0011CB18FA|nr:GNAT family N-acetyltransferase [Chryseobacterium sp.]TXF79563.1 GNAT family N-acetyltransferase [Chryseobacterium sp.]
MIKINTYSDRHNATAKEIQEITDFLYENLDEFGDPKPDIENAVQYAMGKNQKPGGLVITAIETDTDKVYGAVVINKTGMSGYIPENILVYIATHKNTRGKGIGKTLMQKSIEMAEGDIALHCEPENPARFLYEKLGFTSKYLEMRLKK